MESKQLNNLLEKFGGVSEEYKFYNDEITLRFDVKAHKYLLVENGELTPLAGVTTVVKILDKSAVLLAWAARMMADKVFRLIPDHSTLSRSQFEKLILDSKSAHRDKLEEAADVGHIAHAWIEQNIKQQIAYNGETFVITLPEDLKAASCCIAAINWMKQHNVRWINTERKIYSRKYKYAGTLDGIAIVDSCSNTLCCPVTFVDRKSLIDWKSSNGLYVEYILQTAAYEGAYTEETGEEIEDRWIIRLGKIDGEFEPWHIEGKELAQADFETFLYCLHLYNRIDELKARVKALADAKKAVEKAQIQAEREAALMIKCKNADKYKGSKLTKCLPDGSQCMACKQKYEEARSCAMQKQLESR